VIVGIAVAAILLVCCIGLVVSALTWGRDAAGRMRNGGDQIVQTVPVDRLRALATAVE
jgi:hypothetical protein